MIVIMIIIIGKYCHIVSLWLSWIGKIWECHLLRRSRRVKNRTTIQAIWPIWTILDYFWQNWFNTTKTQKNAQELETNICLMCCFSITDSSSLYRSHHINCWWSLDMRLNLPAPWGSWPKKLVLTLLIISSERLGEFWGKCLFSTAGALVVVTV